jgi:hypothetical protein
MEHEVQNLLFDKNVRCFSPIVIFTSNFPQIYLTNTNSPPQVDSTYILKQTSARISLLLLQRYVLLPQ